MNDRLSKQKTTTHATVLPARVTENAGMWLKSGWSSMWGNTMCQKLGKRLFKFCTMTEARDARGNLLPDENRLTAFGQFMRHNSLDKLPELVNVLGGEMSLVGPRPLVVRYLKRREVRGRIGNAVELLTRS
jgi:lipopolysaccharide/colanic/teichoic acid biosynthesis glycosyltransferase